MAKLHAWLLAFTALSAAPAGAQMPGLGDVLKGLGELRESVSGTATGATGATDERTNIAGIKEALAVGTGRAVESLARVDGYYGNEAVRILMPSSIRRIADIAKAAGYQRQVDDFVLSMNRAAEAAVPMAADMFRDAIRGMTLDDVRGILAGGETAATEFFRRSTEERMYAAFKPVVARRIGEVGATRAYRDMVAPYEKLPIVGSQTSLDLDHYVTTQALDGLFRMVGREESRIRADPAARTTDLLRTVFGR